MDKSRLLTEVKAEYKASRSLIEPLITRREFERELYTGVNIKSNIENADNLRCHVPYTKTLFDNIFPILTAKMPISKVSPRNTSEAFTAAKLMDRLIDYTFDVNQYEKKYMMTKKEAMLSGDAFTYVPWSSDPDKNYPLLISLNSNDVSPHPNKLDIDDEWPIYIRREMTKRQMKEMAWNKEAINSLSESKLGNKSYRRKQLDILGIAPATDKDGNPKDDLYEVCIRWGMMSFGKGDDKEQKMGMVVVANNEKIINTDPVREDLEPFESPYENNVMPIAHLQYDPMPNSFFAMSFITPIAKDQVELNDLENMKRSNYYRRNNPPIVLDADSDVDLATLKFLAGMPWRIKGGIDAIKMMELPDIASLITEDQKIIMQRMQNATGVSDFLNPSPDIIQKGGKSATHAAIMNENTKMRFRPQATSEDRYIEKIGKLLINMWQDKNFFNEKVALALVDNEGTSEITEIQHDMVQGELDFVVSSASSVAQSDQAILAMAVQLRELYADDPSKDMAEVDKVIIDKSGFDPYKIIKPKVAMLPELVAQLKKWTYVKNSPTWASLPMVEKTRVLDHIDMLGGLIKQLQKTAQQENPQPQQQQQPPQQGQPNQQQPAISAAGAQPQLQQ